MAGPDTRLSLLIELADRPGALESALRVFSANGVNLTHIESRPARGERFDFYVDCEGDEDDPAVAAVIAGLKELAVKLLVLGRREVPWSGHGTHLCCTKTSPTSAMNSPRPLAAALLLYSTR